MTLTQQNRTRLTGLIGDHRSDWDHGGIEAAIKVLDLRWPNEPLRVAAEAIRWAMDARALTPAAMHDTVIQARIYNAPQAKPAPRHDDPECALHHGTAKRYDGRFVCCVQESATPRPTSPVAPSLRPACPAPAGLRDQVAEALNRALEAPRG